jgi:hypothetical protein
MMLAHWFDGTQLIDLVIGVSLLEWLLLAQWYRRSGQGLAPDALRRMMLPGLCLMLAARSALSGAPWILTALLLAAAGLTHIADLRRRWKS